ncbi:MAG: exo-alpha-sialidase [Acidobacteriales bacterium]|nr:exo-alpha-sialidase [Terriglobales bacterium]
MFSEKLLVITLASGAALLSAAPQAEFVFEQAPFPSCHASTIVETQPGEFLAAWFGGSEEGANDVAIWGARRDRNGWSEPFEMAREENTPSWNPVLFTAADGTIWLYYKFGPSPQQWTAGRRASRDQGRTWLPVEHLPAGIYGPIKNKPLVLKGGAIVSGTSVESYRSWSCWAEISRDNGKTWTRHGPIMPEEAGQAKPGEPVRLAAVPGSENWHRTHGIIQPAVVQLGQKRIRMFVRATQSIGRICYSDSLDGGLSWTPAKPTVLPNPNSGIDAVGLRDGRIVIVYNHTPRGRSPLNLAVSRDGERWNSFLALETEPGEFSYPAIIQARDGDLHVTYTWNRKKIEHVVVPLKDIP